MKKIILSLLGLTLIQSQLAAQDSISVLFIGNSYTYVNDLPGMLNNLTTSLGKEITVDSKTNGGYTFQNQVNDAATYVKIHSKPWDVVVIQGQSQEPSFPDSQVNTGTLPFALRLSDSIWSNNACSNVMYYMTWGRQNGDSQWTGINTFEKMNTRLYNTYMRMADSSDRAMVSPVGAVWAYVRANHPTINLYNPDESHPSVEGTYLAACTFYASLFQQTPVGSTFYGGLNATTAGILQNAVAAVILDSLDHFHLHPVNKPTQANFSLVQNGAAIQLENESSRAISYSWNFGDGQTANSVDAQHTFMSTGTFAVELTASSTCNSDTKTIPVIVTILGLTEDEFQDLSIVSKEDTYWISASESGYWMTVYGIDGKLISERTKLDEVPYQLIRNDQVYLLHFQTDNGTSKIIRLF